MVEGIGAMPQAADFGSGQVFLSMLWFFLFFIWLWLLIAIFGDILRSQDLSGWGKALWTIFIVVLPYLGVFVYLIARGHKMHQRARDDEQAREAQFRQYVKGVAGSDGHSRADEVARLAELHDQGVLNDAEFDQAKAKALA